MAHSNVIKGILVYTLKRKKPSIYKEFRQTRIITDTLQKAVFRVRFLLPLLEKPGIYQVFLFFIFQERKNTKKQRTGEKKDSIIQIMTDLYI